MGFLLKISGGGGGFKGEGPRGREDVCSELGNLGGGPNVFFRGRNVHQVNPWSSRPSGLRTLADTFRKSPQPPSKVLTL